MRTFDDSVIEGAAENFLAGRACGHLSEALTFEDFLAVRELAGFEPINVPAIQVIKREDRQALLDTVLAIGATGHPRPPAIIQSASWPAFTMAVIGITFWLIGRLV